MAEEKNGAAERTVIKYETEQGEVKLSPGIIRKYLVSGGGSVTDQEVVLFMQLCRYQRLNPFLKEAFCIKYGSDPATLVVARDAFVRRADKHAQYDGMESGIVVVTGKEVQQRKGSLLMDGETLAGGWARVYRKDRKIATEKSVTLKEYLGLKRDGTVNRQWSGRPATMIAKVAEAQALRAAFPNEYAGLFSEDEEPTLAQPARNVTPEGDPETRVDPNEDLRAEIQEILKHECFSDANRHVYTTALTKLTTRETMERLRAQVEKVRKDRAPVIHSPEPVEESQVDEEPATTDEEPELF